MNLLTEREWTEDRLDELDLFVELLRTASSLNNANNFLEHAARCIELARRLDEWDTDRRRPSFRYFLEDLVRKERQGG